MAESPNKKEELRKEWDEYPINWISDEAMKADAFNFFYSKLSEKEAETKQVNKSVSGLLAILHGDGGHYEVEHGLNKAILDAVDLMHVKWVLNEHLHDINEMSKKINRLESLLKETQEELKRWESGEISTEN